jgi:hypothetical protein
MKRFFLIAAALLALAETAGAQVPPSTAPQVLETWYQHYLGRPLDQRGMDYWFPRVTSEASAPVLASMLASEEYYNRNGSTPEGFVRGLYRDVLGRTTDVQPWEVATWLNRLSQNGGSREQTAQQFMAGVDILNPPEVQAAPAAPPAVEVYGRWSPNRYVAPAPRPSGRWSPYRYGVPAPRDWQHERDERHYRLFR